MTMQNEQNRVPNKKEVPLQGQKQDQGIKGREGLKGAQKQGDSDIFQKNRSV